jgi:hypothetical protein
MTDRIGRKQIADDGENCETVLYRRHVLFDDPPIPQALRPSESRNCDRGAEEQNSHLELLL